MRKKRIKPVIQRPKRFEYYYQHKTGVGIEYYETLFQALKSAAMDFYCISLFRVPIKITNQNGVLLNVKKMEEYFLKYDLQNRYPTDIAPCLIKDKQEVKQLTLFN